MLGRTAAARAKHVCQELLTTKPRGAQHAQHQAMVACDP